MSGRFPVICNDLRRSFLLLADILLIFYVDSSVVTDFQADSEVLCLNLSILRDASSSYTQQYFNN